MLSSSASEEVLLGDIAALESDEDTSKKNQSVSVGHDDGAAVHRSNFTRLQPLDFDTRGKDANLQHAESRNITRKRHECCHRQLSGHF